MAKKRYYITESDRDKLVRKPDMSLVSISPEHNQSYSQEPGLATELIKRIEGQWINISGETYYYGHLIIYWPEDGYLEEIVDNTVYVRVISGPVPSVGSYFNASKSGLVYGEAQNEFDTYILTSFSGLTIEEIQDMIATFIIETPSILPDYEDALNLFRLHVKTKYSITVDDMFGSVLLVGDMEYPGNTKFYGTDSTGVRGWYPYYTDEIIQDLIGNAFADTDTIDSVYDDVNNLFKWNTRYQFSITSDSSGLKLVGDLASPGNSQYYGTDSTGVKGWYTLSGGGSYTDEQAQDAVGNILVDSTSINFTYTDASNIITATAIVHSSITITALGVCLVNDLSSPGSLMYYGTDSSGVRGWYSYVTVEIIQDIIGGAFTDTNSIDSIYDDASNLFSWNVKVAHSVTITASGVHLINDVATPNSSQYYGTSPSLGRGWHDLPTYAIMHGVFEARLTLVSSDPESISNMLATTLYLAPYKGHHIGLVTGGNTEVKDLNAAISISLSGATAGLPHDVFVYNNAGVLTLILGAWNTATSRGTALTWVKGILVSSANNNYRYVGTVIPDSFGQVSDGWEQRFLWNFYNQVAKPIRALPSDSNHTYSVDSWRAWNNVTTVGNTRFEVVLGLARNMKVWAYGNAYNASEPWAAVGIGFDSTTVNSADLRGGFRMQTSAEYNAVTSAGKHYFQLLQRAIATGTTTWYGNAGIQIPQSGLSCEFWC